jgi:hypothetical protein
MHNGNHAGRLKEQVLWNKVVQNFLAKESYYHHDMKCKLSIYLHSFTVLLRNRRKLFSAVQNQPRHIGYDRKLQIKHQHH